MIPRCRYCRRFLWPWHRIGFITGKGTWHVKCAARVPWRDAQEPEGV
jgi:hypothetical protein